ARPRPPAPRHVGTSGAFRLRRSPEVCEGRVWGRAVQPGPRWGFDRAGTESAYRRGRPLRAKLFRTPRWPPRALGFFLWNGPFGEHSCPWCRRSALLRKPPLREVVAVGNDGTSLQGRVAARKTILDRWEMSNVPSARGE